MLVPDMTAVPPPGVSEVMHTPGPAMVCAIAAEVVAQFEKPATASSAWPFQHEGEPPEPPGCPSLSPAAVT